MSRARTFHAAPDDIACSGPCARCGKEHVLHVGPAREPCLELLRRMETSGRIDLDAPDHAADPRFSLDYLHGPARGQMFGVMVYRTPEGERKEAKAFSGQYNAVWNVPGWVSPAADTEKIARISRDTEREIKRLGTVIAGLRPGSDEMKRLKKHRADLSRALMKKIHALHRVTSFRGETAPLPEIFQGPGAPPSGTGDCCAPKLLNFAALNKCTPLGLAEFYVGRENRSETRTHGRFFPACENKCRPLLGFMLCGLESDSQP